MFRLINRSSHWFVCFFISAAHAIDGVKLPTGAEDQYVSLGTEGSRRVGVGPHGAQLAVSLPAGNVPAALLTCHSPSPPLPPSASTDHRLTDGPGQGPRSPAGLRDRRHDLCPPHWLL